MLWFSGTRGAMAFALALKSKIDFHDAGNKFLPFTLCFASLTLVITDFSLIYVIKKLNIISKHSLPSTMLTDELPQTNNSYRNQSMNLDKIKVNTNKPNENEEKKEEKKSEEEVKNKRVIKRKSSEDLYKVVDNPNSRFFCFVIFKKKLASFHNRFLIPLVKRDIAEIGSPGENIQMVLFDKDGNTVQELGKDNKLENASSINRSNDSSFIEDK